MKIAIVSDLYPPEFIGGYELGMSWITDELRRRQHQVDVFHCRIFDVVDENGLRRYRHRKKGFKNFDIGPGVCGQVDTYISRSIWRLLWFAVIVLRSQINLIRFNLRLRVAQYDLILLGNPLGLLIPIHEAASEYGRMSSTKVGLFVSDDWVAAWPDAYPLRRHIRPVALPPSVSPFRGRRAFWRAVKSRIRRYLRRRGLLYRYGVEGWFLDFAVCCSEHICRISRPRLSAPTRLSVAHWGLPLSRIASERTTKDFSDPVLLIAYVGQIEPHKGLAALLSAVAAARGQFGLVIMGDETTAYGLECKGKSRSLGIAERVTFTGKLTPEEVIHRLKTCHILVLPSEFEEPYAIAPLQGKLCGLVTVASNTGGSAEGIENEIDGFLYEPGCPCQLSRLLDRLYDDRELCRTISKQGQSRLLATGDIAGTVDKILLAAQRT